MTATIDLNADLGEGGELDAALLDIVTSCNIACGGHAGDGETMRAALVLAMRGGVRVGAHPSFPDRENFGRSPSTLSGAELEAELAAQVSALRDIADGLGVAIAHLKPHGALYNMAARDAGLARSVVAVLEATLPGGRLVGPPGSQLEQWARRQGVGYIREGFADRAYERDGSLRSRNLPGALLAHGEAQAQRAVSLAVSGEVETHGGEVVALRADTICLHGDSPGALDSARAIRDALKQAGVALCPPA